MGRRVRMRSSAASPHTHSGRSGGHTQPPAPRANRRLTIRSSSEWYEMTAHRPPGASTSIAWSSPLRSASSSWLTAIRSAWKVRRAGCPLRRAAAGTAWATTSASWVVVSIGRLATMASAMRLA